MTDPRDATQPGLDAAATAPTPPAGLAATIVAAIRTRIFSGLILALPVAITLWIVFQLYTALQRLVVDPIAYLIGRFFGVGVRAGLPEWWVRFVAPVIAIGLALTCLYLLGWLVRSRVARAVDWAFLRVPVVTIIYKAVRDVIASVGEPGQGPRFRRVVLIDFPHPGTRALAFVTNTLRDDATGQVILSVCVLTGVMPPSGFTLFVPESDVTDSGWTVNEALQAILSGGMTAPPTFHYRGGPRVRTAEPVNMIADTGEANPHP